MPPTPRDVALLVLAINGERHGFAQGVKQEKAVGERPKTKAPMLHFEVCAALHEIWN